MQKIHRWRLQSLAALAGLAMAGCGGGARKAPPEPKGPATVAEMAPSAVNPFKVPNPTKRYTVIYAEGALPEAGALEDVLATASVVANVEANGEGLSLGLAGAVCEAEVGGPLPEAQRPTAANSVELKTHGIERAQAEAIAAARATVAIACNPDGGPATSSVQAAGYVAEALAKALKGHIYDPDTGRHWPPGAWGTGAQRKRFDITRAVWARPLRSEVLVVATSGMKALGLPELAMGPLAPGEENAAAEQLYLLGFSLTAETEVGDGFRTSVGPQDVLLWAWSGWAGTRSEDLPAVPEGSLAVVDPALAPGLADAASKLLGRLTVR